MNHLNFYQETNNLNLNKMLIPLGVGIVGSIILGFLYASLVYFIPFPYLTFFVAIGLAMAIGLSARLLIRIFRITGKKNRIRKEVLLFLVIWLTCPGYYYLIFPSLVQSINWHQMVRGLCLEFCLRG
jgi:hypothetical protein